MTKAKAEFTLTVGSDVVVPESWNVNLGIGGSGSAEVVLPGAHHVSFKDGLSIVDDKGFVVFDGAVTSYTYTPGGTTIVNATKPGLPTGLTYFGHAASGLFAYGSGGMAHGSGGPAAGRGTTFAGHLDMDQFFVDEFIRGIREGRIEV